MERQMNKSAVLAFIFFLGAVACIIALMQSSKVNALADSMSRYRSYTVTCGATATSLLPSSPGLVSFQMFKVFVPGATEVYFGDPAVTTSVGMPYCSAASCRQTGDTFEGSPSAMSCIVASGTVTIRVLAGAK